MACRDRCPREPFHPAVPFPNRVLAINSSIGGRTDWFEDHTSLDECVGFFEYFRICHWGEEVLRLPAFEQYGFPDLGKIEDGLSTWRIEWQSL